MSKSAVGPGTVKPACEGAGADTRRSSMARCSFANWRCRRLGLLELRHRAITEEEPNRGALIVGALIGKPSSLPAAGCLRRDAEVIVCPGARWCRVLAVRGFLIPAVIASGMR